MFFHMMVDIETLSTKPNSVILSIAAVEFDIQTGEIGEKFHTSIDTKSCFELGMVQEQSTLDWWAEKSEEAKAVTFIGDSSIQQALIDLANFFDRNPIRYSTWANSPSFDLVILKNAYDAVGDVAQVTAQQKENGGTPWIFRQENCVRTLSNRFPEIKKNTPNVGNEHNALDDCLFQIAYLCKLYKKMIPKTLEEQASIQHDIWSHWMKYLFSVSTLNDDGSCTISRENVERWGVQVHEEYKYLSDSEQQSNKDIVNQFILQEKVNQNTNGFVCIKCGGDMVDTNPNEFLMSNPLQKNIHCSNCGHKDRRFV